MPSPFPGMDPYLESPSIWPDVHHELISQIRAALNPVLRPHYVARVELRVYETDVDDPGLEVIIPDVCIEKPTTNGTKKTKLTNGAAIAIAEPIVVPLLIDEIKESRVEIIQRDSGKLVTIIEVLSPSNKIPGSYGRKSFLEKRQDTVSAQVNWVEVDLLRTGKVSLGALTHNSGDYRVIRYRPKKRVDYWPVYLRDQLPVIGVPLRGKEPDVPLDMQTVFAAAYENGAYDMTVDYRKNADPPLSGSDRAWAEKVLKERNLR